jgi:hypothetical protein
MADQGTGNAWLDSFGPDEPPPGQAPNPPSESTQEPPPNLPPGAHDIEEVPTGNQAQVDKWKKTGKGPDGKPHPAMVLDTQAPTTGNPWLDQFGPENPPEPPPPPSPAPPPGLWDRAKAAAGEAYQGAVDATSQGMDKFAQADIAAGSKLNEPISEQDGLFTRFAKNYVQSRNSANQQMGEAGNFEANSGAGAVDPRNVAAFAAKASLALLNEGWSMTGIPAAITTLMSQPTQQLLDAGAEALNKSGVVKQGAAGEKGFGITTGDVTQAAASGGDMLDQVYQNIVPVGPHMLREGESVQHAAAAAEPVAPPGTLAERRARFDVQEQPESMMEHAQAAAMKTVEAQGGDKLAQVVAATDVNATMGAHYHAGEYEGHVATRHAQVAEEDAANEAQAAEEQRNAAFEQFQASDAGKASAGKTPDDIWAEHEGEQQADKEADFGKALNQKGDAEIERAETLNAGAEKGGATEPGPTIGEALPEDTVKAFQSLKERRAAEAPASTPQDTIARIKEATPEGEGFKPLPPGARGEEPLAAEQSKPVKTAAVEKPETVDLHRGTKAGAKPAETPFYSDDRKIAEMYAGKEGVVDSGKFTFKNLLKADNWVAAKKSLGLPLNTSMPDLLKAAKEAGHDGLSFKTTNGREYVDLGAKREAPKGWDVVEPEPEQAALASKRMQAIKAAAEKRQMAAPTSEMKAESPEPVVGATKIAGEPVAIQVPKGQVRNGGRKLEADYGEFTGHTGADGDNVDVLIGQHPNDKHFIVDHLDSDGVFEQHKVLSNFSNKLEAMRAYRAQYPDNPQPHVSEVNSTQLKGWLNGPERMRDGPFDVTGTARASAHAQGETAGIKGRARFRDTTEINGSGESSASLEAIRRVRMEQEEGRTRHQIDPDGNATPLTGVDAVDAKAPKGHIIVQGNGEGGHTILDRGGLSQLHANGLLNRARATGGLEQHPGTFRDHVAADAARAKPVSRLEAQRTLSPFLDKVGRKNVEVHQDTSTLPDNLKRDIVAGNHNPRGVYDPNTDTVHIIAGAHDTHADVLKTAIHEMTHKGLSAVFDSDAEYTRTMNDVYRGATDRKWLSDYAAQHNIDARTKSGCQLLADEYAAHLAENVDKDPSTWQKIVDGVRAGLRKMGVVRDWNDNDIRALVRRAQSALVQHDPDAAAAFKDKGIRYAEHDEGAPKVPDDHPLAVAHKLGKTMEDQANYNPGFVRSRLDYLEKKGVSQPDNGLQFLGLRNLKDMNVAARMPDIEKFIRTHDQMTGRRGQIMEDRAATTRDWSQWISKNKEQGKSLGELMHSSTLAGVDPSKPFKARWPDSADATQQAADKMRKTYYDKASKAYAALDPKGKELFNKVRDDYAQHRQQVFDALEQRVNQSAASEETKKSLMTALRQKFEAGRVQSPYFPLQRFGDHWAAAKDADGNTVSFSRFESRGEKNAWIAEMKNAGYDVRGGERMDSKSMMEQINPDFVKKVTELAKEADPSGGLADDIWQEYLKAMPEMSMRKHFIHRQGRLGYSMDAMRAYSYNSFHGSHQLARLEYGNRLDGHIENIKNQAQALNDADPSSADAKWGNATAREMQRRYDWIKNPKASSWASALTKFGFGWYLGAAPATAFRIFSQNPMIASPVLAAYHGQFGATKELSRASAQWAMSRGGLGDTLRGDERKAFDTARDMGVFSSTATQDLASSSAGGNITGIQAKVAHVMGYMFNAMEHHNRQTTYLAAYRLGRTQGMDHGDAVEHATDRTWDSHFDYANANRPRVLQNDFAKVAFLFKQYSWGITYRLARDARDMFNNDPSMSDADRSVARKTFAGMLSRSMIWGGMTGLPTYWIARAGINAMLGDKDQPYDVDAALHHHLEQSVGKWAADSIMTGPMGATTGASLASGASYNDLWYRPPAMDENASGMWSDLIGQFMGAIPQIGAQVAQGAQMIHDGNTERGFEHFLPPALSGVAKAIRYAKEGVTNLSGESVMKPEELNTYDIALQALGMTPQKVADRYAQNTALKNISKEIMTRKVFLTNSLERAASMDDDKEVAALQTQIEHFNSENPGVAIGGKGLVSSFRNHFKNQAEAVNGVRLPPGLSNLRDTYGGNPDEEDQQ